MCDKFVMRWKNDVAFGQKSHSCFVTQRHEDAQLFRDPTPRRCTAVSGPSTFKMSSCFVTQHHEDAQLFRDPAPWAAAYDEKT